MIILLSLVIACSKAEKTLSEAERADADEWAEMDTFHLLMAEVFHPYQDSANLEPVKRLADELVQQSDQWTKAPLPATVNNDEVKAQLNQLQSDTRSLSELIQRGASDEEIGTSLRHLHSSFHSIMEAWNGGHHEHKE
jgi:hypothetical protein